MIDFPSSPTNGQSFTASNGVTYVYQSPPGQWNDVGSSGGSGGGSGGASVTTSDTPPTSPADGDLWWNSTTGRLLVWYDDGSSSQWVPTTPAGSTGVARSTVVTYYIATTGSDTNDGASAATPVLTFQKALDLCVARATYSPGPFTIQSAPGTYTVLAELTFVSALLMGSTVTFNGTTNAGVPTTIIQGSTDGTRTHSFITPGGAGLSFVFKYIRFQSFDYTITSTYNASVILTRVYAKNCNRVMVAAIGGYGAAQEGDWDGRDLSNVVIPDGIGCSAAIGALWNLKQEDPATQPFALKIHHYQTGMQVTEGISGHMDYMQFEDCSDVSVELMRGTCAPNMSGLIIRRSPVGIRAIGPMAGLLINDAAIFDTVPMPIQRTDGPTFNTMDSGGWDSRLSYMVRNRTENTALTGTVAESSFYSVMDIVPGRMRAHDRMVIHMYGPCGSGLAGVLTFRLKFGGVTFSTMTVPVGSTRYEVNIVLAALNNTSVLGRGRVTSDNGTVNIVSPAYHIVGTSAVSTTVLTNILITAQLGNAADSINMNFGSFDSTIAGLSFP